MKALKAVFVLLVLSMFAFLLFYDAQAQQNTLTISRVSDNPKKHYKRFKPFIDYLAKRLKHAGIKSGKVLLVKNNHQMIQYLKEGKVDIITETPYSSIIYMEKGGTRPVLRRWKKGMPTYFSYIFVRKNSGLNSLEDLKGKVIALEDPGSTTAYFLPKIAILRAGLEMVELASYKESPPADKVGYCFAGGEVNISHWVHKGLVAAGALSSEEYQEPDEVPLGFLSDFKVIYTSDEVPRNLISIRDNLDPKLKEEIVKALLDMKFSEDGRKVMWAMGKTINIDEFPEGVDAVIKGFKEKYSLIKKEIELEYPE